MTKDLLQQFYSWHLTFTDYCEDSETDPFEDVNETFRLSIFPHASVDIIRQTTDRRKMLENHPKRPNQSAQNDMPVW